MIDQKYLIANMDYDKDKGILSFKNKSKSNGWKEKSGYLRVAIEGKNYMVHRLIWMYEKGYFPENGIDHINRNPSDNRISNLREVTQQCNRRNIGNTSSNTSGVKGVSWISQNQKWAAAMQIKGKTCFLGYSEDLLEAACMRLAGEQSVNWSGCDSSSPAYLYVTRRLNLQHPQHH